MAGPLKGSSEWRLPLQPDWNVACDIIVLVYCYVSTGTLVSTLPIHCHVSSHAMHSAFYRNAVLESRLPYANQGSAAQLCHLWKLLETNLPLSSKNEDGLSNCMAFFSRTFQWTILVIKEKVNELRRSNSQSQGQTAHVWHLSNQLQPVSVFMVVGGCSLCWSSMHNVSFHFWHPSGPVKVRNSLQH